MPLVTCNDRGVFTGSIMMPMVGVWSADLTIDQTSGTGFAPGTRVTIDATGFQLQGTVDQYRAGDFLDTIHVRVLGGAGGMAKKAQPRSYVQPSAFIRDVINGLANDAGEKLASTIDQAFMTTNLVAWSVMNDPIGRALGFLLEMQAPTFSWRMLADGSLWIGPETWPQSSAEFVVLNVDPTQGTAVLGVDAPAIMPGVTLPGLGQVARVEHIIDPSSVRSHVWKYLGEERGERAGIAKIVQQEITGVDYFGLYEVKVVAQQGDSVDVSLQSPYNARIGGLQRVPLRLGTGMQLTFTPGAKCLLGWRAGNPTQPYVCLGIGADRAVEMVINGGINHAARVGDSTSGHVHALGSATAGPYPVMGTTVTATDTIAENGGTVKVA